MQRVIFRADGNAEMGLGHVYRSLALAEMLKGEFELIFIIKEPLEELAETILQTCDECIKLAWVSNNKQYEITKVIEFLEDNDIVVLDGYHFDGEYQKQIREACYKVISIDDMHQGHFYSDYVLNHCGALDPKIYNRESYTKLLLGEQYALLRPSFLQAAQNEKERNIDEPYTLFLCMGGSDYYNITSKVLRSVQEILDIDSINIVLGAANEHRSEIRQLVEYDKRCKIHSNLSGQAMCDIMRKSDIAMAPGSSISFEICAIGMGFITGYYTINQHDIVHWLGKTGCASVMGDFRKKSSKDIRQQISYFLNEINISGMLKKQQTVDGHSEKRLLRFFQQL